MTHKSLHSLKKNSHKLLNILKNSDLTFKKKFTFFSYFKNVLFSAGIKIGSYDVI